MNACFHDPDSFQSSSTQLKKKKKWLGKENGLWVFWSFKSWLKKFEKKMWERERKLITDLCVRQERTEIKW